MRRREKGINGLGLRERTGGVVKRGRWLASPRRDAEVAVAGLPIGCANRPFRCGLGDTEITAG